MLTFDPKNHIYRIDGEIVPSVTQALSEVGIIDASYYTEWARERGKAVHSACHYYDEGDLDETELDPGIVPYLEGWKKFRAWWKQPFTAIEVPACNPVFRYAGTPDRLTETHIIDIKSGQESDWWGEQLAGYDGLYPGESRKRLSVRLDDQGNFYPKEWKDRNDWKIFLAALSVCHWKRANACH